MKTFLAALDAKLDAVLVSMATKASDWIVQNPRKVLVIAVVGLFLLIGVSMAAEAADVLSNKKAGLDFVSDDLTLTDEPCAMPGIKRADGQTMELSDEAKAIMLRAKYTYLSKLAEAGGIKGKKLEGCWAPPGSVAPVPVAVFEDGDIMQLDLDDFAPAGTAETINGEGV